MHDLLYHFPNNNTNVNPIVLIQTLTPNIVWVPDYLATLCLMTTTSLSTLSIQKSVSNCNAQLHIVHFVCPITHACMHVWLCKATSKYTALHTHFGHVHKLISYNKTQQLANSYATINTSDMQGLFGASLSSPTVTKQMRKITDHQPVTRRCGIATRRPSLFPALICLSSICSFVYEFLHAGLCCKDSSLVPRPPVPAP